MLDYFLADFEEEPRISMMEGDAVERSLGMGTDARSMNWTALVILLLQSVPANSENIVERATEWLSSWRAHSGFADLDENRLTTIPDAYARATGNNG